MTTLPFEEIRWGILQTKLYAWSREISNIHKHHNKIKSSKKI